MLNSDDILKIIAAHIAAEDSYAERDSEGPTIETGKRAVDHFRNLYADLKNDSDLGKKIENTLRIVNL